MQAARGATLSESLEPSTDAAHAPATTAGNRTHVGLLLGVAVTLYVVDQVTKHLANEHLGPTPTHLVGSLLKLDLVHNPGAAFGIAGGATVLFSVIAVVVVVVIARTARTLRSTPWAVALGLLVGGAIGNLTDRVFREPGIFRGRVVDFLELPHWPVFNVADMGITCAAVLMALLAFRGVHPDGAPRE
ncbi:signal peptidase II [Motilibacter peucedani]|uniref:Lipoprotein signal peptidase n=1 Tax=Motilibacter peucedani TaxID=598650 RepID=A0A420XVH4_9ACTN|nr:signal peptidase II [Motilibacter peucedani]RKS84288.1 signal peptidase II [Motilibacter peucedani]